MKTAIAVLLAISMLALVGCGRSPDPQKNQTENLTPASANEVGHPSEITREDAQKIALDHAGVTADVVNRLHTEYDRDRISHYEVSFHYNGYEYDYDIHAETGDILDFERELDD